MFIAPASDQRLEPQTEGRGGGSERKTERGRERQEGNKRVREGEDAVKSGPNVNTPISPSL